MHVVPVDGESVGLVFCSLQVGQIESHDIAFVDGDVLWVDMASNKCAVDIDMVAFSLDSLLTGQCLAFVWFAGKWIGPHRIAYFRMKFACSNSHRLVRLAQRYRHIVK